MRLQPRIVVSQHARRQALRRGIAESTIRAIAIAPEQIVADRPGREIRQSRWLGSDGRMYLMRLVVELYDRDILVVTVYRTSKVAKYWRAP